MRIEKGKKIYVSGKISDELPYRLHATFGYTSNKLRMLGYKVINPIIINDSLMRQEFSDEDRMRVCFAAIDVCDGLYMLKNWKNSKVANREREYALKTGKDILYQIDND